MCDVSKTWIVPDIVHYALNVGKKQMFYGTLWYKKVATCWNCINDSDLKSLREIRMLIRNFKGPLPCDFKLFDN